MWSGHYLENYYEAQLLKFLKCKVNSQMFWDYGIIMANFILMHLLEEVDIEIEFWL